MPLSFPSPSTYTNLNELGFSYDFNTSIDTNIYRDAYTIYDFTDFNYTIYYPGNSRRQKNYTYLNSPTLFKANH